VASGWCQGIIFLGCLTLHYVRVVWLSLSYGPFYACLCLAPVRSVLYLRFSRKKCTMVSYYSSKLLTENLLVLKTAPTQNEPRYMQHTQDSG
jgi:hypothetical protein